MYSLLGLPNDNIGSLLCCNLFSHNGYVLFLSSLTHDSEIKMKMKTKQKRSRNGVGNKIKRT